jgi:uncharacterized Fe-S center protein
MSPEQVIAAIGEYAMQDLVALGKAIYDLIEKKANAESVAATAVLAGEVAADIAEKTKFGP